MIYFLIPLLFCFPLSSSVTLGKCYPVEERDFREVIRERANTDFHKVNSGHVEALESPKAVSGLKKAEKYKKRYFDPTIVTKKAIRDHEGNVIVPAGKRYNPLRSVALNNDLIIFDAEDEEQLVWAESLGKNVTPVLVKGHPLEIEEQTRRPVYFDQNGTLTEHFGIEEIPAKISQEGELLVIETIPVEEAIR